MCSINSSNCRGIKDAIEDESFTYEKTVRRGRERDVEG